MCVCNVGIPAMPDCNIFAIIDVSNPSIAKSYGQIDAQTYEHRRKPIRLLIMRSAHILQYYYNLYRTGTVGGLFVLCTRLCPSLVMYYAFVFNASVY